MLWVKENAWDVMRFLADVRAERLVNKQAGAVLFCDSQTSSRRILYCAVNIKDDIKVVFR